MAADSKRKALGRGLSALLPAGDSASLSGSRKDYFLCPIENIFPNKYQPRKVFNDLKLTELVNSVREKGILQPLIVRAHDKDSYELIAGERRWRAAQKVGLKEVPVLIKEASDKESLELAIIENIQRADLNPVEEAEGYKRLIDEFSYTQEEMALKVGKDRATITNHLRILKLPGELLKDIASGLLSLGHAKALLSIEKPADQLDAGKLVAKKGLSVRETEALAKKIRSGGLKTKQKTPKDLNLTNLEERLRSFFGTKVKIAGNAKKGKIELDYYSSDELDRLIELLGI